MIIKCSKCKNKEKIIFKPALFGRHTQRDATKGVFLCPKCGYQWSGLKYWRAKYDNVETEK